jgi:hypothetical protein
MPGARNEQAFSGAWNLKDERQYGTSSDQADVWQLAGLEKPGERASKISPQDRCDRIGIIPFVGLHYAAWVYGEHGV